MSAPLAVDRSRAIIRVWGRDPVKMIQGLATADITAAGPERAVYTAFLTPKGRMVADARILPKPAPESGPELFLTTSHEAAAGLLEHLRKFIPPLFARFEDVSASWKVVGVYGHGASEAASAALRAVGVDAALSGAAAEDAIGAMAEEPGVTVVRSAEAGGDGWEILLPRELSETLAAGLERVGVRMGTEADLEPLRIAAGRPRWGTELTGDVIPLEAGLERAISQSKGCYTGQEVIVRILHRGHVNRHLRALSFEGEPAAPGTELFEPGVEKPRGQVTSVAPSGAGLGYVRREVTPPAELRAGSPDGPPVRVTALP